MAACDAAALSWGACLEERGLSWSNVGYADADAFRESCEVQAWEWTRLEREEAEPGVTEATCAQREAPLREAPGCESWEAVDWQAPPWE
ncbi:MAG: hypothetical protein H6740_21585 [Alphaproteobacteria bacterium]|nr:hypothetical protein [Alphaproteobacteria bacterium]